MTHSKISTKKMVTLSILISQALVLHIIERVIPVPIPVPGIKLGLANIISLFTIIIFGYKEAVIVVLLRTFLGSIFGGGISSFLYSIAGGLLSATVMALMLRRFGKYFSIPTVSVCGAVFHNIAQISVASAVLQSVHLFYYLPVLVVSAVITGIFIGLVVQYTMNPLKRILKIEGERYVL